jgi:hypothetical protein
MASQRPPATTPEGRENQLIAKAVDLAEKQLEDGTASAQVITHYLKLGSTRERLEQERMMREIELMEAKAANMASAANIEKLYNDAINVMRGYSGQEQLDLGGDEDPNVF